MFVHFHDLIPADDDVMTEHTPHFTLCILSEDDDGHPSNPIHLTFACFFTLLCSFCPVYFLAKLSSASIDRKLNIPEHEFTLPFSYHK